MKSGLLVWSKAKLYALFLCLCVGVMSLSGLPLQMARLWRIAQAPGAAVGVVTLLNCREHGQVGYTFLLEGKTIPGSSRIVEDARCETLWLGDRVNVSYELAAPDNNYAFALADTGPDRAMRSFWTGAIFLGGAALLGPLFLVFVAQMFLRLRSRFGF